MGTRAQRVIREMGGLLGLKGRYWQQTVPPVPRRAKLWVVRRRLKSRRAGGGGWGPYRSPWLPRERRRPMRREIRLERADD